VLSTNRSLEVSKDECPKKRHMIHGCLIIILVIIIVVLFNELTKDEIEMKK
jgi:hypothetical protein